jgi:phospholipid/cholesterol/gamma-HCH transport system substrate-binding protein
MKFLYVVMGALFGMACAARRGPSPFGFRVEFSQTVGLKPGDQVCMLGVPIGKVKQVNVMQKSSGAQPVVDVEVSIRDSNIRVRKDDTFRIATEGLLGNDYLEIDPAKFQSPPIATGSAVPGEVSAFSPMVIANVQPLMEIARKLAALPPDEQTLMMTKFLKLLDQAPKNPSHGNAGQPDSMRR